MVTHVRQMLDTAVTDSKHAEEKLWRQDSRSA